MEVFVEFCTTPQWHRYTWTTQLSACCPVLGKTTFAFSCKAIHTISVSFPFFALSSDRKAEKGGGEAGEDFQFEAAGFVSKPSVVWLNYKCTCLITSLSGACQGLHPKNKPWHIKKNAICFEWWQCLVSVSSPCVGRGPEVTTSTPHLLNLPVPLTPGATQRHGPLGTIIQNQGPVSDWTL